MDDKNNDNRVFKTDNILIAVVVIVICFSLLERYSAHRQYKVEITTADLAESGVFPREINLTENRHRRFLASIQGVAGEWSLMRFIRQDLTFDQEDSIGKASSDNEQLTLQPREDGLGLKNVSVIYIDAENIKWFCTESGIVSYDGIDWKRYESNENIPHQDLKGIMRTVDSAGSKLWVASPLGATVVNLPIDDQTEVFTHKPENSDILSQEVLAIAAGKNTIRWIGTEKGISALSDGAWLTPDYQMHYTKNMFRDFPITSMAASSYGDTLYAGTAGAGVARVYRDELDAISGASVYAEWGPIIMPSDYILSIFIAPDGRKWFGTDKGIATHIGDDTLDKWMAYTTDDGLIDNYVQAICMDLNGNIWFGTPAGISVFDGVSWKSYTTDDGLVSNNIKSLATGGDGVIWIGSEVGIMSYKDGEFVSY
jgi:ligand-binding sensor domain-containing protein